MRPRQKWLSGILRSNSSPKKRLDNGSQKKRTRALFAPMLVLLDRGDINDRGFRLIGNGDEWLGENTYTRCRLKRWLFRYRQRLLDRHV
jgi:hypothetical protein